MPSPLMPGLRPADPLPISERFRPPPAAGRRPRPARRRLAGLISALVVLSSAGARPTAASIDTPYLDGSAFISTSLDLASPPHLGTPVDLALTIAPSVDLTATTAVITLPDSLEVLSAQPEAQRVATFTGTGSEVHRSIAEIPADTSHTLSLVVRAREPFTAWVSAHVVGHAFGDVALGVADSIAVRTTPSGAQASRRAFDPPTMNVLYQRDQQPFNVQWRLGSLPTAGASVSATLLITSTVSVPTTFSGNLSLPAGWGLASGNASWTQTVAGGQAVRAHWMLTTGPLPHEWNLRATLAPMGYAPYTASWIGGTGADGASPYSFGQTIQRGDEPGTTYTLGSPGLSDATVVDRAGAPPPTGSGPSCDTQGVTISGTVTAGDLFPEPGGNLHVRLIALEPRFPNVGPPHSVMRVYFGRTSANGGYSFQLNCRPTSALLFVAATDGQGEDYAGDRSVFVTQPGGSGAYLHGWYSNWFEVCVAPSSTLSRRQGQSPAGRASTETTGCDAIRVFNFSLNTSPTHDLAEAGTIATHFATQARAFVAQRTQFAPATPARAIHVQFPDGRDEAAALNTLTLRKATYAYRPCLGFDGAMALHGRNALRWLRGGQPPAAGGGLSEAWNKGWGTFWALALSDDQGMCGGAVDLYEGWGTGGQGRGPNNSASVTAALWDTWDARAAEPGGVIDNVGPRFWSGEGLWGFLSDGSGHHDNVCELRNEWLQARGNDPDLAAIFDAQDITSTRCP